MPGLVSLPRVPAQWTAELHRPALPVDPAVRAAGAIGLIAVGLIHVLEIQGQLSGAAWLTAGIALIPGIIKPDDLTYGPIAAVYTQGWLWIAIWGVLAAVGIIEQLMTTARLERDVVAMYSTRSPM